MPEPTLRENQEKGLKMLSALIIIQHAKGLNP